MSKLLIYEKPLIVLPGLIKVIGLNEAIFLQQVKNRSNKMARLNLIYLQQTLQEDV
jgi:hypothetical protein